MIKLFIVVHLLFWIEQVHATINRFNIIILKDVSSEINGKMARSWKGFAVMDYEQSVMSREREGQSREIGG